ncbi:MAG: hypothetical protein Q7U75_01795 [Desulfobacterales bacterium]|nr:hypothetical protein [Desulfobacterales bacterium]
MRENKIIWANPDTSLLEKFVQARNRIFFRICRYNNSGAIERPVGLISRFSLEMDSIPASMQKIVRNAYATIDGYIVQGVELAVKNGELGADTPTRIVMQLIRSIFFATPLAASISEFKKYDERLYGVLFTIRRAFGTHPAQTMDWPALPPAELEPGG